MGLFQPHGRYRRADGRAHIGQWHIRRSQGAGARIRLIAAPYLNFADSLSRTSGVTNLLTSPSSRAISLTSLLAIAWWFASAIRNTVSTRLSSARFMPTI